MDREVFRDNLRRLAAAQGLDFDGLAIKIGLIDADKKWLRRLWNDGLQAINKRRSNQLENLAAHLRLPSIDQLWQTNTGKREEIEKLATRAFDVIRQIDKLRSFFPDEMRTIASEFRSERAFVAEWICDDYGLAQSSQIKEVRERIRVLTAEREDDSDVSEIIEALQANVKEWDYWLWSIGGEKMAKHLIKEQWRDAVLQAEKTDMPLTPDLFAKVFRQRHFPDMGEKFVAES